MAIAVHIVNTSAGDPRQAYEETWRLLTERGMSAHPPGQQFHAAWLVGDELHVFNIWDSPEDGDAFMRDMAPVLAEAGMELAGAPVAGELLRVVQPTGPGPQG